MIGLSHSQLAAAQLQDSPLLFFPPSCFQPGSQFTPIDILYEMP